MCLFCLGASKKWRWDRSFSIFYGNTTGSVRGCCRARTVPCRDEPFSLSAASCACTQDLVTSSVPTHRLSAVPCSQNHGAARPAAQRSHTEGVSGSTRTACYPASQPHTQANAHTYRGLGLDHLVAELIWVSERRPQPQGLQAVLLAMVRHRSLLVVLLLLQQPQLGPRMGLGTLPMFPPRGGVLPSGHGGCAGGVCGAGVCSGTTGGWRCWMSLTGAARPKATGRLEHLLQWGRRRARWRKAWATREYRGAVLVSGVCDWCRTSDTGLLMIG